MGICYCEIHESKNLSFPFFVRPPTPPTYFYDMLNQKRTSVIKIVVLFIKVKSWTL